MYTNSEYYTVRNYPSLVLYPQQSLKQSKPLLGMFTVKINYEFIQSAFYNM